MRRKQTKKLNLDWFCYLSHSDLHNCVKNSPLQTPPPQVISHFLPFVPLYISSVHQCAHGCGVRGISWYNSVEVFSIHFLILQSAVCSPLSEKYYIIKMIAIIIINIQTTKVRFPNQQQETLLWVELVHHLSFHERLLGQMNSSVSMIST